VLRSVAILVPPNKLNPEKMGCTATADMAIASILEHPNVYAEITLTPVTFGIIDYLAKNAGADRIVYGSDLPMRDPRQQLGWVVFSRLSQRAKERILWRNAWNIMCYGF